ncbi:Hypothetical_protein [Hexamita inflata]|uniref:Hypothetical_protein n=1 Tax=Hexamita inflata TaxID=28002 RepID=A0AA86UAF1_9EUKA|nr:Hypothetical protein HINF_LOCUS22547 [Hexamita inflata]CAI9943632.1 Hypothetical protein HINF_LOCUS31277 [Hexamita inflata]
MLNFSQNQKSQILKVETDSLELNLNCWCTSRDTLGIITTFASDNYRRIYNDSTNIQIQPEKRYLQNQTKQGQFEYWRRLRLFHGKIDILVSFIRQFASQEYETREE